MQQSRYQDNEDVKLVLASYLEECGFSRKLENKMKDLADEYIAEAENNNETDPWHAIYTSDADLIEDFKAYANATFKKDHFNG